MRDHRFIRVHLFVLGMCLLYGSATYTIPPYQLSSIKHKITHVKVYRSKTNGSEIKIITENYGNSYKITQSAPLKNT